MAIGKDDPLAKQQNRDNNISLCNWKNGSKSQDGEHVKLITEIRNTQAAYDSQQVLLTLQNISKEIKMQ